MSLTDWESIAACPKCGGRVFKNRHTGLVGCMAVPGFCGWHERVTMPVRRKK